MIKESSLILKKYDGGFVKFACEEVAPICGKGTISIKMNDVYYVKGLRDNLLSVSSNV